MDFQEVKERIAKKLFDGRTTREAIEQGICLHCGNHVYYDGSYRPTGEPGQIYSEAGFDEFRISGMCETCFDKLTKEPDA